MIKNNRNTKRKKIYYTSSIAKGTYDEQLDNAIEIFQICSPETRYVTEIKNMKEWYRVEKDPDIWGDCKRFSTWRVTVEYMGETKVK